MHRIAYRTARDWLHRTAFASYIIALLTGVAVAAEHPGFLAPANDRITIARAGDAAWNVTHAGRGETAIDSALSYPARTGDSFELKLRLKAGLGLRALPALVCYDAQGREIKAPSPFARSTPYVTTDWRNLERVIVVHPAAASVRARLWMRGRGSMEVADLEFLSRQIDPYETGALVTQLHPQNRSHVVLESNFGIVNRDRITTEDRDGDGKWALVTIDLDELTKPEKKGEDWRTGFEDNPNVILWSDGAVLK